MPSTVTFSFKRGDTLSRLFQRRDSETLVPVSLTGTTIRSQLRRRGVLAAEFTPEIIDAAQGRFSLSLTNEQTAGLSPGVYDCDIEYTNSGGVVRSTATFTVEVKEDVTRD